MRARALLWAAVGLPAASCSLVIHSFNECSAPADCASRGSNYVCRQGFCVPLPQGCQQLGAQTGDDVLTFGLLLPKTNQDGSMGAWGPFWEQDVMLVVNEMNPPNRTGIHGKPIRIISCDTQSQTPVAASEAAYLVDGGVQGILCDGSSETIAESAVTVPAGVLLLSGAATSPEITFLPKLSPDGTVPLVWRTTPSDALQGPVIARELTDGGTVPKVAVFERNDAYGQGLFQAFSTSFAGSPSAFLYPPGGDVTTAVSGAAAFNPDWVVVIGFPNDVTNLINGAASDAALSNTTRWFFTQGGKFAGIFALANQGPLSHAIGTAPAASNPNSPAAQWFRPQYQQAVGQSPDAVVDTANMFDAAMLLMVAADYATAPGRTLDGTTLAHALTHVSDGGLALPLIPPNFDQAVSALEAGQDLKVSGASGSLAFDITTGEAPAQIEVWTVADGGFVTLEVVNP